MKTVGLIFGNVDEISSADDIMLAELNEFEGGLSNMTVVQLKEYAKTNSIDIGSAKTKAEILDAINAIDRVE